MDSSTINHVFPSLLFRRLSQFCTQLLKGLLILPVMKTRLSNSFLIFLYVNEYDFTHSNCRGRFLMFWHQQFVGKFLRVWTICAHNTQRSKYLLGWPFSHSAGKLYQTWAKADT